MLAAAEPDLDGQTGDWSWEEGLEIGRCWKGDAEAGEGRL